MVLKTRELVNCVACYDGYTYDTGQGKICFLCNGNQKTSFELMKIYEANRFVHAQDPLWDGDDASREGVSMYSLAMWYRSKESFGPIVEAQSDGGDGPVLIMNRYADTMTLHGVSWGYGGEGPQALAAILADGGLIEGGFNEAIKFVQQIPFQSFWNYP